MSNEITVVEQETGLVANEFKSFVDTSEIPKDKLIIPRLNLLQALSPAVQNDAQKQGTFNNSVSNYNYGETVELMPIKPKFGAIYFVKGEGLKCKSNDGITSMHGDKCEQCPFGVNYKIWGKEGEPPACQETVDILCLEVSQLQPVIVTFKSTTRKIGQKIATMLAMNPTAFVIRLGSEKVPNDNGFHFIHSIKATTKPTADIYNGAKKWSDTLSKVKYEVSDDIGE